MAKYGRRRISKKPKKSKTAKTKKMVKAFR